MTKEYKIEMPKGFHYEDHSMAIQRAVNRIIFDHLGENETNVLTLEFLENGSKIGCGKMPKDAPPHSETAILYYIITQYYSREWTLGFNVEISEKDLEGIIDSVSQNFHISSDNIRINELGV